MGFRNGIAAESAAHISRCDGGIHAHGTWDTNVHEGRQDADSQTSNVQSGHETACIV